MYAWASARAEEHSRRFPMYAWASARAGEHSRRFPMYPHGRALELESTAGGFQCIRMGER